jgi:hypothetical protein
MLTSRPAKGGVLEVDRVGQRKRSCSGATKRGWLASPKKAFKESLLDTRITMLDGRAFVEHPRTLEILKSQDPQPRPISMRMVYCHGHKLAT